MHDAPKKEAEGDHGSPNAKDLGALMECSERVTLIGITFSSERWGLVCAQDDIQLAYGVPEMSSNGEEIRGVGLP